MIHFCYVMLLPVLHFISRKTTYFFFKCLQFLRNLSLKKKYLLLFLKKLRLLQLKVCFPVEWKNLPFLSFCLCVLYCISHWFVLLLWILLFWFSDNVHYCMLYVLCSIYKNIISKYWISVMCYVFSILKQFFGNLDLEFCNIAFTMELGKHTFNIIIFQSAWSAEESHFWRKSTYYRRKNICCHSRGNPITWRYTINRQ